MAEAKTKRNDGDVEAFLASTSPERRRHDAQHVCALMADVTGEEPAMWGSSIVGFGSLRFTYADGRSSDWFVVGFSPRRQSLTLYLMDGFEEHSELLEQLGPHSTGKSCLYIKRLDAVDTDVLRKLIAKSVQASKRREPPG
ncbi:MAG: DUF1801 domain-containing protein [Actinomycetes bacterium]|jgi:hypothetical protein